MIKKFEKYTIDIDEDIADEYAKHIISKYIDKKSNGTTIEDIFYDVIKSDNLEEQEDFIKGTILMFLKNLFVNANKIRSIEEIDAEKYNL